MLTGLTDDEKKEIEAKVAEYRKKCEEAGMDAKPIQSAIDSYYKQLLKEYGAKFDPDFNSALMGADGGVFAPQSGDGAVSATSTGTVDAAKSPEANTASNTSIKSDVQTDPDGTVYLVITSPNGVSMKIKIGTEGDSEDELAAGVHKAKNNIGADYEKTSMPFLKKRTGFQPPPKRDILTLQSVIGGLKLLCPKNT